MNRVVDLNHCQGYAQRVFLAPRVFTLHGEEALLYTIADQAEPPAPSPPTYRTRRCSPTDRPSPSPAICRTGG
ncbi:ferredoxin [Streptomyces lydicus]|uniref:ferredoxin n=1 Tax=Streptomyces lydicus TaxID=47763 RepID=UPI0037B4D5F5